MSGTISLRERLKNGQNVYGTCITSTGPMWPKAVKQIGLDFVFIDTEHIPLDRSELARLCQQFRSYDITPIVRIPSPDPYLACQAIDGGAIGIVAPYLESVEQVQTLVGATKYRPLKGEKLAAYLNGTETLSPEMAAYIDGYNTDHMCIANIESVPAMNRLDEMLSVPGLDAVFIGPHDLSVSLELPEQYDHPDFEAAVRTIIHKTRQKGLSIGIHFSLEPERQIQWMAEGANIVVHSFDIALFSQRLRHDMAVIKEAAGDLAGGTVSDSLHI
ncbi:MULTISPECIES: aldolase/citrate lyase family protein [unclassified Spirosoma]|uniref:HpcH/HpaI aldolase family protein n=1 Tax=unclassified Spirosoma TaxID=2621999 RepID=UPI000969E8B0|nr:MULTISPECIES: aldolase/citrate lyase family protein [unclassified Spirosoma]MBN8826677.1 aldolase [Spirosoma sp.]OJW75043.1 MAG: aldolase [Spirosoma sp. 48-14]